MTKIVHLGIVAALLLLYWPQDADAGYKMKCYKKGLNVLESHKIKTNTGCKALCMKLGKVKYKHKCTRWTLMDNTCFITARCHTTSPELKQMKGTVLCKPRYSRRAYHMYRCNAKTGLETKFHKTVHAIEDCEEACSKTKYCVAAYYIQVHKLCSLRLCKFKTDHSVAKPADGTFLPCSHKPCTGTPHDASLGCSAWFNVYESAKHVTSASCQAMCTKEHHCRSWTMMRGLCHLNTNKKSKLKGMKTMSNKQYSYCRGNIYCSWSIGKESVYHKTMPSADDCQDACKDSAYCSGMYYLHASKLCTLRLCQLRAHAHKNDGVPSDKKFQPCSHKPCHGWMKNSVTGKVRCYETRGYVLHKSAKKTPKACQRACTHVQCYSWTMVNKECTMIVSTRAKTLKGFKLVDELHFSYCRPKKRNVHKCEYKKKSKKSVYEKKVKSEAECELACAKTALCVSMIYINAGKHCSLLLCRENDDHWTPTTPHDKSFKLCGYKTCSGLKGKKPATCFTRGFHILESSKTTTSAACQARCTDKKHCWRWTMIAGLCHLTVPAKSKHAHVKGMHAMSKKAFTFCFGSMRGCKGGTESVYHKSLPKWQDCKKACLKTPTCSGLYYLRAKKVCTIRICQKKGSKTVAKPADKTFKPCSHKPCQGRAKAPTKKSAKKSKSKMPKDFRRLNCHVSKYMKVLESTKTTTTPACKALCIKGHCIRWTMMAGLCHISVLRSSKMIGMKTMTSKQFIFCKGHIAHCRGKERVFHKTIPNDKDCKFACWKTPKCSGVYYIKAKKLCTIRVCQKKGSKDVAKPTDKTFKPCSHKPCQGKAAGRARKKGGLAKRKGGLTHCHQAGKKYHVLESKKTTTAAACQALCTTGHCSKWTMMAGLCHLSVPKRSKLVGMKSMTKKQFTFCSGKKRCHGTENVYHKMMSKVDDCRTACSNTATCSGMYYLTKQKLCTIRVCQKKGSKDVAKPTDKTFKPCSHKPCQGKAAGRARKKGGLAKRKGGLTRCHQAGKKYHVLESKKTTTAAACQALCTTGHCSRWTMMAGLCHLSVPKRSKLVGMKSMTKKQFTFCSGKKRCHGTEKVYHKKMKNVHHCKTACSKTATCSGVYYLTKQKLCTIRVCQKRGSKDVAKPADKTFKPCSHKPCQGKAAGRARKKGGSARRKGGLTHCHQAGKKYHVLESKKTTTAAACQALCTTGHCSKWTMMAGLCHLSVPKRSKLVGMKSMTKKQFTFCSGKKRCHGTEKVYHKKMKNVHHCKTACSNTATCSGMYYLTKQKLCTIRVCQKKRSKDVAKPADKTFKPCSHKPCQGQAKRGTRKGGRGKQNSRLNCRLTHMLNLLESKKTTTSAHCKTLCSKDRCFRWTMMANLCHLTVSKHRSKLNGMKTMTKKLFTFCKGKMLACAGLEKVYHKKMKNVHHCKTACSNTATCSGMYYLTKQKLCTIRVCQKKGSKDVAKPADKTFKPCSHKPCQGHPRDEKKARKKNVKKPEKKKAQKKAKPLNCAMSFWFSVLESKKTITASACKALCVKGHCSTWTMMDGLCHLTVPKSSKLVGMKTMSEKQFTFCTRNVVCSGKGTEHVYNKKKIALDECKSTCSQTSACSGIYYLTTHKLCTMKVCQEKGKAMPKPADKAFKQCSHKPCHGKAVEGKKKKKSGYNPQIFWCPQHFFLSVLYSKTITKNSACAAECKKLGGGTCFKWVMMNGACYLVCSSLGQSNSMAKLSHTEYTLCGVRSRMHKCKTRGKESIFHKTVKTDDDCKEACAHTTLCSGAYFFKKTKHCSISLCKTKSDKADAKPYDKTFKPCKKPPCTGLATSTHLSGR
ncbi:uncharacterized protein LOC135483148 isoform X3 [Lineus longissimus]|uniref:uncharacterized protein LOC135483148 isoform X3 n=1 Tax=Lineus longissimus TaxID=88925 RepID=UPI00315D810D